MEKQDKLVMVWTSGDKEVAIKMAFMYTINSKRKSWWQEVTLVIWGPSAKLLSEDKDLQEYLAEIKAAGVKLQACKTCAEMYGVSGALENMGVEVIPMGQPLTSYLKAGASVLTV